MQAAIGVKKMGQHGGRREGSGRPKINDGTQKSVQIAFRVTEEQKKVLLEKAEKHGLTLSQYLLKLVLSE